MKLRIRSPHNQADFYYELKEMEFVDEDGTILNAEEFFQVFVAYMLWVKKHSEELNKITGMMS